MNKYHLTIRFEFPSTDDILAREKARKIMNQIEGMHLGMCFLQQIKLQEIFDKAPPRGVSLEPYPSYTDSWIRPGGVEPSTECAPVCE